MDYALESNQKLHTFQDGSNKRLSLKHRVEIVTSSVLKKELYSLMIICDNTEGVLSSSNCHLHILKKDNKSDIIKQNT